MSYFPAKKPPVSNPIKIFQKTLLCPVCGERSLAGYTYELPQNVILFDKFLLRWIKDSHRFTWESDVLDFQFAGFLDLHLCSNDYFCSNSNAYFNDGKPDLSSTLADLYKARSGTTATLSPTFPEMFLQVLLANLRPFLTFNWLDFCKKYSILTYDGWISYNKIPTKFANLLREHLRAFGQGINGDAFKSTTFEFSKALEGGFPGLFTRFSFFNPTAIRIILHQKIYESTFILADSVKMPIRIIKLKENLLHFVLRQLLKIQKEPAAAEPLTSCLLCEAALRLAEMSYNPVDYRRCLSIAFLASEIFLKGVPWNYTEVSPSQTSQNNEAMGFRNLILRRMLRIGDRPGLLTRNEILYKLRSGITTSGYNNAPSGSDLSMIRDTIRFHAAQELGENF